MPAEAIPFVIAIVAAFVTFIAVVGGVQVWMALPDKPSPPERR